jgi:hypothetical protein
MLQNVTGYPRDKSIFWKSIGRSEESTQPLNDTKQ